MTTKGHVVKKISEYTYSVLSPNPDAGKECVSYSGAYLTTCHTDSPEEAARIAKALNLLDSVEALREPVVVE